MLLKHFSSLSGGDFGDPTDDRIFFRTPYPSRVEGVYIKESNTYVSSENPFMVVRAYRNWNDKDILHFYAEVSQDADRLVPNVYVFAGETPEIKIGEKVDPITHQRHHRLYGVVERKVINQDIRDAVNDAVSAHMTPRFPDDPRRREMLIADYGHHVSFDLNHLYDEIQRAIQIRKSAKKKPHFGNAHKIAMQLRHPPLKKYKK